MEFVAKLNKKDMPYMISDEIFTMADGKCERFLDHDNVNVKTIEIFTQPLRQGEKVLNYTIEKRDGAEWKLFLRVFSSLQKVYVNYESYGDTVEAEDINNLQQAVVSRDAEFAAEKRVTQEHRDSMDNPHGVTKAQVGLGNADNTADTDKPVSIPQGEALETVKQDAHTALIAAESRLEANIAEHKGRVNNPHTVTKEQVGLANLDNVKQASKAEFDTHNGDSTRHITASERQGWTDKYTKNEVDNKFATLENAIDWKEAVATFADIAKAYPSPQDGWTVNVKDTDYTYRYSGTAWVAISANAIPKATTALDGLLSKEDKVALDDAGAKKHTHGNKTVIDGITAALVTAWNSAVTHISDGVKHITAAERTLWNTVSNKVDKVSGKGLSTNDYTAAEKSKLAGIAAGANSYTHPASHPASMITGLPASLPANGGTAAFAGRLTGNYTGNGGYQKPNYFGEGLRLQMMNGLPSTNGGYHDVLVCNSYIKDVPICNALAMDKSGGKSMYLLQQNANNEAWTNVGKLWHSGNFDPDTKLQATGVTWNQLKGV